MSRPFLEHCTYIVQYIRYISYSRNYQGKYLDWVITKHHNFSIFGGDKLSEKGEKVWRSDYISPYVGLNRPCLPGPPYCPAMASREFLPTRIPSDLILQGFPLPFINNRSSVLSIRHALVHFCIVSHTPHHQVTTGSGSEKFISSRACPP